MDCIRRGKMHITSQSLTTDENLIVCHVKSLIRKINILEQHSTISKVICGRIQGFCEFKWEELQLHFH